MGGGGNLLNPASMQFCYRTREKKAVVDHERRLLRLFEPSHTGKENGTCRSVRIHGGMDDCFELF